MKERRGGSNSLFSHGAACTLFAFTLMAPPAVLADGGAPLQHSDPVTQLLLSLSILLLGAKLFGSLAVRCHQPAVLGELFFGVLLGNLSAVGLVNLEFLRPGGPAAGAAAEQLEMLGRIGVILLLFEVGLDSSVAQMRRVGSSALLVAVLGVVTPFALGWFVTRWLAPDSPWPMPLFIGATLCATSVGITARVLKDLGKSSQTESQIILGAAVIDDVLGLVVLAVVQGIIVSGTTDMSSISLIVGKAVAFLIVTLWAGRAFSPFFFRIALNLRVHGMLGVSAMCFCFLLAWAADAMGLAPIVGAFAAGLLLDESHYAAHLPEDERRLEEWVLPLTTILVPIFFVMMGLHVDLRALGDRSVVTFLAGILLAAILGKQVCGLGVLGRGADRLSVGIGMIPRGEVGLIFAAIGEKLVFEGRPVVGAREYTAIVLMVMITTMITPPLLAWSLGRRKFPGSS